MDGERLIEAVRKYEILYVSSQKSYKSNEKKAEAWLKVSEEVEVLTVLTDRRIDRRHLMTTPLYTVAVHINKQINRSADCKLQIINSQQHC